MIRYVIKRLLALIPVLLGVILIIFLIMDLTPGDPARLVLGNMAPTEALEAFREQHGLNDPIPVRYGRYVAGVFQGDFGTSWRTGLSVTSEVLERFPATLELAFYSLFFSFLLMVPLGIVSAVKQNSLVDNVGMVVSLIGIAMPSFWLGLVLILQFSLNWGLFPSGGYGTIRHLALPVLTTGALTMANIARMTRSSMLEIIRQDYIRTALAKGVRKRDVILKHALRNAWIPVITVVGIQFGTLLGGIVIVENVFSWPGLGNFLLTSIQRKDTPAVLGGVVFMTMVFCLVNLAVDIIYAYVDPRIKAQYK